MPNLSPECPGGVPSAEEILQEAMHVAETYSLYGGPSRWCDWSANAKDDFWAIAQDALKVPIAERIEMPAEFASREE